MTEVGHTNSLQLRISLRSDRAAYQDLVNWSVAVVNMLIDENTQPFCRAVLKGRTNSIRCKFSVLKDRKTISSCT
jgi:hypothetical protein